MADFNVVFDAGDVDGGIINVINEIPLGSNLKVEWNRKLGVMELDRIEPSIFAKPCNYGFIPQTLDGDGDELDVLLIAKESIPTGVKVTARVVGIMNFEDDGEMDHKVVCVVDDNRDTGAVINDINDVPELWIKQVEYHFNHYKDLKKPGTTTVQGWGDVADAKAVIKECQKRWTEQ
jgi:inorganic pyrophosphatase